MAFPTPTQHMDELEIRTIEPRDMQCIERLSRCGLLEDTWADAEHDQAYLDRARRAIDTDADDGKARFWVAEVDGVVVATIGSDSQEPEIAVVAWLRVDPVWRETCLLLLTIYTALKTCMDQGFVKVRLEAQIMAIAGLAALFDSGHLADPQNSGHDREADHVDVYPSLYAPWRCVQRWEDLSQMLGISSPPEPLN